MKISGHHHQQVGFLQGNPFHKVKINWSLIAQNIKIFIISSWTSNYWKHNDVAICGDGSQVFGKRELN